MRQNAAEYQSREKDIADIYTLFLSEWTPSSKKLYVSIKADAPDPETLASIPECAESTAHWEAPKAVPDLTNILGQVRDIQLTNNYNEHQLLKHGLLTLSAISFDDSRETAALTYSHYCGGLCGSGATLIFKKTGNTWSRAKDKQCNGWLA